MKQTLHILLNEKLYKLTRGCTINLFKKSQNFRLFLPPLSVFNTEVLEIKVVLSLLQIATISYKRLCDNIK